ncbi:MAG: hypothetical protein IJ203_13365 [Atopobiaceae bacterium]|nr:hypothetical protein [Atopobiaceae bacterium]
MTASDTHLANCETHTWTGSGVGRVNEDYALFDERLGCAVLVDGATGLTKANIVPDTSDAAWYARTLSERLLVHLADPKTTMTDAFVAAGREAAEAFRTIPGAEKLARIDEPNGSVVALRWQGDQVQVGLLGDCTAVVTMRDAAAVELHDATLTLLDDQNYERMYRYATERGTTMAEARKALNPRFIENRLKMNEPDGYWAADVSCRGMAHVLCHEFSSSEVVGLFACSDGYAAAVDMGVVGSAAELARRVALGEGEAVGGELRAAEELDAGCWRVHRSKTSDDATYVHVSFAR